MVVPVIFLLSKMRADGRIVGFSRVYELSFHDDFCYRIGDGIYNMMREFAKTFPELDNKKDPSYISFIGKVMLVTFHFLFVIECKY